MKIQAQPSYPRRRSLAAREAQPRLPQSSVMESVPAIRRAFPGTAQHECVL